ncbi:MAG: YegP family protein [Solirubrobacteraceae bacterium]
MATASKKVHTAPHDARAAQDGSKQAPMNFLVYEDNGGEYHWSIVSGDGATLSQSEGFASYADADREAHRIHQGIGSARFTPRHENDLPLVAV